MQIIYPSDGHALKNKINGTFSLMACTPTPENWETVDISEYEAWKREHPAEIATTEDKAEAYDILTGVSE